ncbi:MAG TPA: DUF2089 domain-containing protein [Levilinea sp.]|nr:DUF2089 domain-containing protein [Levilinea sp.]
MNQQMIKCPVCGGEMVTTRQYCSQCDTTIEGHFLPAVSPFAGLTPEQIQFVLTFVRCEGRFTRLEEELSLSYPTLRNRLNEIIRALGYEPGREETPVRLSADERRRILEDLDEGRISSTEARTLLRGRREDG